MHTKKLALALLGLLITSVSCSTSLDKEKEQLKGCIVQFNINRFDCLPSKIRRQDPDTLQDGFKFIVFYDSIGCNSCRIEKLGNWNAIVTRMNSIAPVKFYFIFAPTECQYDEIAQKYYFHKFVHDIYIDRKGAMQRENPFLNNTKYHCFLIGNDNKLLFVGDPTKEKFIEIALANVIKSISSTDLTDKQQ